MTAGMLTRSAPSRAGGPRVDPRIARRRQEVVNAQIRRRRRRFVALLVVTALAVVAVGITRSPLLDVDHVRTVGATRTGPDVVIAAAGISVGDPMAAIDLAAAEARIERLPWVADATVTRDWPGTVRIAVIERVRIAVTDGPGSLLVDRDGRLLGTAADTAGLPSIGPRPAGSGPGGVLPEDQQARVTVVAALPASLAAQVAAVTDGDDGIALVLTDGIVVQIGDAVQLRAKFDVATARLARDDRAALATIDVTVPSAPALTRHPTGGA